MVIYPNDHRPAHVHVMGNGGEVVFMLNCPSGPPELRAVFGFGFREVARLEAVLAAHLARLCEKWGGIHGAY